MLTLEKITAAAKELPAEFSIDELISRLRFLEETEVVDTAAKAGEVANPELPFSAPYQPVSAEATARQEAGPELPPRPANLTPEQAAEWDYYTSPEAQLLYSKFPSSPEVRALRGIIQLAEDDQHKSYKTLLAEALERKYGK